jgi:hypothetical protein
MTFAQFLSVLRARWVAILMVRAQKGQFHARVLSRGLCPAVVSLFYCQYTTAAGIAFSQKPEAEAGKTPKSAFFFWSFLTTCAVCFILS